MSRYIDILQAIVLLLTIVIFVIVIYCWFHPVEAGIKVGLFKQKYDSIVLINYKYHP